MIRIHHSLFTVRVDRYGPKEYQMFFIIVIFARNGPKNRAYRAQPGN